MRTIDADHEAILGRDRRVDLKVEIQDGDGTFQNMRSFKGKDWILGASWGEDIDTDCMTCDVELIREQYNDSLAPLNQVSRTNLNAGGSYDRLIDITRRIKVYTRYAPADANADALDWIFVFDGYIDIIDWATETVKLTCRDKYSKLQDTFIEDRTEYSNSSGVALEVVIQDIIDDWIASPPTLIYPSPPGWYIKNFNAQLQSVADQVTLLSDQIGWRCRYKWQEGSTGFSTGVSTGLFSVSAGTFHSGETVTFSCAGNADFSPAGFFLTDAEVLSDGGDVTKNAWVAWLVDSSLNEYALSGGAAVHPDDNWSITFDLPGGLPADTYSLKIGKPEDPSPYTGGPLLWEDSGFYVFASDPDFPDTSPIFIADLPSICTISGVTVMMSIVYDGIGPVAEGFKLTLYEPDRAKVAVDRTFTDDEYYDIPQMEVSTKDIRNAVKICYPDPADLRADKTPKRKSVTRTDGTSITAYGRRWMMIAEDGSSHIDTLAEAQAFGDAILTDLAYPLVSKRVTMPYFAFVELDDLYTFDANDIHYTSNTTFAVVGYRHRVSDGECTTEIDLHEESVVGRHTSWFKIGGGPGMGLTPDTSNPIAVDNLSCTETNVGILATWGITDTGTADSYNTSQRRNDITYEIYVTEPGGTPSAGDLVGTTKSNSFHISSNDTTIPTGIDVDVHVRAVSPNAVGSYVVATNKKARPIGTASIAPECLVNADGISTTFNDQTNGTAYPPDNIEMDTGSWGSDAILDDGSAALTTPPSGGNYLLLN